MRLGSVINTMEELSNISDEAGETVSMSMDGPASFLVVALPVFLSRGLRSGVIAAQGRYGMRDSC